jgi:hypothetical protein
LEVLYFPTYFETDVITEFVSVVFGCYCVAIVLGSILPCGSDIEDRRAVVGLIDMLEVEVDGTAIVAEREEVEEVGREGIVWTDGSGEAFRQTGVEEGLTAKGIERYGKESMQVREVGGREE